MRQGAGQPSAREIRSLWRSCRWFTWGVRASSPTATYQLILSLVPIWALFGVSWNLLSGYGGQLSFGHASFFGIGAYTSRRCSDLPDLTPWLGIPLGAVMGAVAGVVIGIPTFRLRGHYFALAMLAYPLAILYVLEYLGLAGSIVPDASGTSDLLSRIR